MKLIIFILLLSNSIFCQCPYINLGPDIDVSCNDNCIDIVPSYSVIRETTSYNVTSIPYNPEPYNSGITYNIAIDDRWSGVVTLPFTFCFFNQTYNQYVISTNGIISFNTSYAGLYSPWPFTLPIPTNSAAPPPGFPRPMIGLYHDIDPSLGGTVRYGVIGAYPCRKLVISFDNIPHFNCITQKSKFQIVLFEITNIIEIHVEKKQTCFNWNGGRACLGIQNDLGTLAYTPPGRNTSVYTINTAEAWRFEPSGITNSLFQWYNTNDSTNPYNHCYSNDSTLIGVLSGSCGNNAFTIFDTLNINYSNFQLNLSQINHN